MCAITEQRVDDRTIFDIRLEVSPLERNCLFGLPIAKAWSGETPCRLDFSRQSYWPVLG